MPGDGDEVHDEVEVSDQGSVIDDAVAEQEVMVNADNDMEVGLLDELNVLARAPAPRLPPPPLPPVAPRPYRPPPVYEDSQGYVSAAGSTRPIGRITAWETQVSARCSIPGHLKCGCVFPFHAIPYGDVFKDWLAAGLCLATGEEHMSLPKPRRAL